MIKDKSKMNRGFTLVEMLIALVMAGIVIAPLYIITRGMSEQADRQRMEVESMQRVRVAINLLSRDFSRAGLFTSPNTAIDNRFINNGSLPTSLQFRAAVVHLNRNTNGNDGVMITGNFLGSELFEAQYTGGGEFKITSTMMAKPLCERLFDPDYAFAHITNKNGLLLDSRAAGSWGADGCTVSIADSTLSADFMQINDAHIRITANQTALYMVEADPDTTARTQSDQLVRYFVDYTSPNAAVGLCSLDPLQIDGTVVSSTRTVLASDVVDFQVWFRGKADAANPQWNIPNYPAVPTVVGASGANFAEGLVPPDTWHVIPTGVAVTPNNDDVSCSYASTGINPADVRSAMVRLAVKTQMQYFNTPDPGAGGRLLRRNFVSGPDAPFKIRTLVTEIEMPNLAARAEL